MGEAVERLAGEAKEKEAKGKTEGRRKGEEKKKKKTEKEEGGRESCAREETSR